MPSILRLNPEEIDTVEKRAKFTVGIIGCGEKGILYSIAFAEAGYKVTCADADQSLVRRLARGKTPFAEHETEVRLKSFLRNDQISTVDEIKDSVSQCDIIVITNSARIDDKKNPDYSEIEKSCKQSGAALRRSSLVIYGGTASFGSTDGLIREILENTSGLRAGADFGLAYTFIQPSKGQTREFSSQELTVAANDKTSLDAATAILKTVTKKGVKQISNVKVAELTVLFAAAKRDANVALANELAVLCENAGVDYFELIKFLTQDTREGFDPTIAVDEGREEAYLLLENAENLNAKLSLTALARQINENMGKHVVSLTQDALRSCGKTLRRARVAVLGPVGLKTATETLVRLLEARGAKISVYDPLFGKTNTPEMARASKRSITEAVEGADSTLILTAHDQFKNLNLKKLRTVMRMPAAIVDLTGKIEIQKVEKEGLIYRGLGRGVERK